MTRYFVKRLYWDEDYLVEGELMVETEKKDKSVEKDRKFRREKRTDEKVQKTIEYIEKTLYDSIKAITIKELNEYQMKSIQRYFEKIQEYRIKTYRENDEIIMKVYPVGSLRRLAEQKAQEVLMKGKPEVFPPMGSFERFVIHDYLKEREGVKTESLGKEGNDRHIEIHPLFGRTLKKTKKRLIR